jgi:DNA-binding transcriptional MerR regulator
MRKGNNPRVYNHSARVRQDFIKREFADEDFTLEEVVELWDKKGDCSMVSKRTIRRDLDLIAKERKNGNWWYIPRESEAKVPKIILEGLKEHRKILERKAVEIKEAIRYIDSVIGV